MKNWRTNLIFLFLIFAGGAIIWRLYCLQIKSGDYYQALALGQQIYINHIKGERGNIFINDAGEVLPLSQTVEKRVVYLSKSKILALKNPQQTIEKIASILKKDPKEINDAFSKSNFFKLDVSDEVAEKVKKANISGAYIVKEFKRIYPKGELAAHVVGFTNQDGQGQYGIEGYYNDVLAPARDLLMEANSPFGYLVSSPVSEKSDSSLKGADVFLTLDYDIQYFSEKILKEAKKKWNIDSGEVIVEDPNTGKILAMAQYPSFDPNDYVSQKNLGVFVNNSIQKLFEPGSVFKAFTMAAGLDKGLVTPDTEYVDKGYVNFGGPPIYNFEHRVWGKETMTRVLEMSINTGAVFVEQKLGSDLFLDYLNKFGFFEKTGIDLQGEAYSQNENIHNGRPRDFAVASFGQGIEITPIQLVRAFAAIANGGKLMRPYVVDKIVKSNGEAIKTAPKVQRTVISPKTAAKLTSMLIEVVDKGSAHRGKIKGYYIAGKTGTAQVALKGGGGYSKDKTVQSFIGYFPALKPKVVILIKLDNPKNVSTAGLCAVPLFKELAQYIIDLWQIPPSY